MRSFLAIILLALTITGCKGINKVLKNPDPEYKLRVAEKYYVQKKYVFAQMLFEDVLPFYNGRPEFEDIYYKFAYCAYYQNDFLSADYNFKKFLEIFPNSKRAEEIDYMRAYCFYRQSPKVGLDQTNTQRTIGMMQTFINTHPNSPKNVEATGIIDICRKKLEEKDFNSAQLYYNIGQFHAAAVAFTTLIEDYPESLRTDEYKLLVIKSYFRYAELSIEEKKRERFEKVIDEVNDFTDRFPDSKLLKEAERYISLSQQNIKNLSIHEQTKTPA